MRPASAAAAAATLRDARECRRPITPFTDADRSLDAAWGYGVQDLDRQQRLAAGETVIGAKLGLTSEAKQQRMNVAEPIVGFLTDVMRIDEQSVAASLGRWIHPRIEPEIAFVTGRDISGPLTLTEAARAVDAVTVAAEVIDSRYDDYRFRLPDVVADNTSAAGLLTGPPLRLDDLDTLVAVRCALEVDGQVVHRATGAAILGHPLLAVAHLATHLAQQGQTLPAGSLVLAGALTDAVPLVAGSSYVIRMDTLGAVSLRS